MKPITFLVSYQFDETQSSAEEEKDKLQTTLELSNTLLEKQTNYITIQQVSNCCKLLIVDGKCENCNAEQPI